MDRKGIKHQVWRDKEGLTGVCFENSDGDDYRKIIANKSELIYTFYASSHFEAMTIYYKYMDWGEYQSNDKLDNVPYDKIK